MKKGKMKKSREKIILKGEKGQQPSYREVNLIGDHTLDRLLSVAVKEEKGKSILYYKVEGFITLTDFLKINSINQKLFLLLLQNIVIVLKKLEQYYFSKERIEWSLDFVYVDPATWYVYFMYVPLQPYESEGNLKGFLCDFIAACSFESDETLNYVQELIEEVHHNTAYTVSMLDDFCNRFRTSHEKKEQAASASLSHIWLESQESPENIIISKFPFRIGKMEGVTDYRIYNHKVSRKHADFIKEQEKYYIIDLGTTNGTYLDGEQIESDVKKELFDGMSLRLADMEFKVHIEREE